MRCADVNVLVYAHRPEAPRHDEYRAWLERVRVDDEPLGLVDVVLSGFLRVVTNPRIFREPTPLPVALEFIRNLREGPSAIGVAPGPRHRPVFERLCRETEASGNAIPDAFLAAIAIEQGATWFSADRGFARYPGLRWRHPLSEPAAG
ncbi:MAG: type II toxin-antitoxin system VapC family toxin [Thermoleophilia bacterium]